MIARSTVQAGENIVSLASRLLGDPQRWLELAQLNHLKAPYLATEPRKGCLSPGDVVLYPAADNARAVTTSTERLDANTYKRDLVSVDNDLAFQNGTLSSAVGLPNLYSAVARRINTLIGRHPFHPGYGSLVRTHIGEPADATALYLMLIDAKRAVLTDPRVTSVSGTAQWENEMVTLDLLITPILPGEPFRFVGYY